MLGQPAPPINRALHFFAFSYFRRCLKSEPGGQRGVGRCNKFGAVLVISEAGRLLVISENVSYIHFGQLLLHM